MLHEQIIESRACATYQCRVGITEGRQFHGEGSGGLDRAIQRLQESSLPVCPQGAEYAQAGSHSRAEDSFHGQVIDGAYSKGSAVRRLYRQESERYRSSSAGGLSAWKSWTRLSATNLQPEESSWNSVLIVCRRRKSSKFIKFLFPARFGRRVWGVRAIRNQRKV